MNNLIQHIIQLLLVCLPFLAVGMQQPSSVLATPTIEGNSPICMGSTLKLETTYEDGIIYHWFNSVGKEISVVNTAIQPSIDSSMAGLYKLVLEQNNQFSDTAFFNVVVVERPLTPTIINNGPICELDTLRLEGPSIAGASYEWIDPFGAVFSTEEDPILEEVLATKSGKYFLEISYGGCTSLPGQTEVGIVPTAAPELEIAPFHCEGDDILIQAPIVAGADYFWSGPNGFTATEQDSLLFVNSDTTLNGSYNLVLSTSGCDSGIGTIDLTISPAPTATLTGDSIFCRGEEVVFDVVLEGIGPFNLAYIYSTQLETITTDKKRFKLNPNIEIATEYNLLSVVDQRGCQGKVSGSIPLQFVDGPTVSLLDSICDSNNEQYQIQLEITEGLPPYQIEGVEGEWLDGQFMAILRSREVDNTIQVIDANNCRTNFALDSINCSENITPTIADSVTSEIPNIIADAGANLIVCGTDSVRLNGVQPTGNITGRWETNTTASIQNNSMPTSFVQNIVTGENTFYWILSTEEHPDFTRDSVVYTYVEKPIARQDIITLSEEENEKEIEVLKNDDLPEDYLVWTELLSQPLNGVVESLENGTFVFEKTFNGGATASFDYQICYETATCLDLCDTTQVQIEIALDPFDPGVFIPDGITPNGDGLNDNLVMLGLEQYPDNELLIFDRWGNQVFQAQPYLHNWDGTWRNKALPEGAYYFVLRTEIGRKRTLKGSVYIFR